MGAGIPALVRMEGGRWREGGKGGVEYRRG